MERINNMFKFATKELSQDACLCWLVNYINTDEDKQRKEKKHKFFETGRNNNKKIEFANYSSI